jgi:hypothetical protein
MDRCVLTSKEEDVSICHLLVTAVLLHFLHTWRHPLLPSRPFLACPTSSVRWRTDEQEAIACPGALKTMQGIK